ncbi:MAG: ABC transporter ATP-binding protein [Salinarimonadaceae bacterium]|nr:MAG: ABC transporter ATP-binding protein [Salinarimonadaceae bacterium]
MSRIELQSLRKTYGSVVAVNDLSLSIVSGEFVTLLGPSGCGKTTTMRMVAGLEKPDRGTISIGERQVHGPSGSLPTFKRELGMVFQSYAVWPHMTVYENVAFPLERRKISASEQRRRVNQVLERVELSDLGDRYPAQLSGGQQQRVALARALVAEPAVILFDEPLSNLDAQLRETMRDLLLDLHRQFRLTAVYVTHDQSEAMSLSDRIYIMNQGDLIQGGTPDELYDRPSNLFVAQFIGNTNTFDLLEIDAAAASIRLPGGQLLRSEAIADNPLERKLIVRPHRIRIAADGETDNVLPGRVASVTLLGDRVRYVVQIEGGVEVVVDGDNGGPRAAPQENVFLRLPPEACVVI